MRTAAAAELGTGLPLPALPAGDLPAPPCSAQAPPGWAPTSPGALHPHCSPRHCADPIGKIMPALSASLPVLSLSHLQTSDSSQAKYRRTGCKHSGVLPIHTAAGKELRHSAPTRGFHQGAGPAVQFHSESMQLSGHHPGLFNRL